MESELWPALEDLEDDIDSLTLVLQPLLETPLPEHTAKLPLVDQAKLYVLATYAIESLTFSYLDLNGIKAKDHPVMRELTRVKQYFTKIRQAETTPAPRDVAVDKAAAKRFIQHALSGNDQYDQERAEREARERQNAHIRFNELGEIKQQHASKRAHEINTGEDDSEDGGVPLAVHGNSDDEDEDDIQRDNAMDDDHASTPGQPSEPEVGSPGHTQEHIVLLKKNRRKRRKNEPKVKKKSNIGEASMADTSEPKPKKRKKDKTVK